MSTGRKFKTNLPGINFGAQRSVITVNDQLQERQDKQKEFYDWDAKELPPLLPEQPVRMFVEEKNRWEPAVVIQKDNTPRSYHVKTSGTVKRRNRWHLKSSTSDEESSMKLPDETSETTVEESVDEPKIVVNESPKSKDNSVNSPQPLRKSTRTRVPVKKFDIEK